LGGRVIKSVDIKLEKAKQGQKLSLGSWMPRWIGFDKQSGEFRFNKHADTIRRIATEYAHGKSMYQIAIELTVIKHHRYRVVDGCKAQSQILYRISA
jgi:hypothetical protein